MTLRSDAREQNASLVRQERQKATSLKKSMMSFPASSTMVPAVEEVQIGRIQKREILQTDIQEEYTMVLLHM